MQTKILPVLITAALLSVTIPAPIQGQRGQPVELPPGSGQRTVQTTCTECHRLNLLANSPGYTAEGNMMATADGNLVLACSGVNRVALVEISE
jgi:hypothetical protein